MAELKKAFIFFLVSIIILIITIGDLIPGDEIVGILATIISSFNLVWKALK